MKFVQDTCRKYKMCRIVFTITAAGLLITPSCRMTVVLHKLYIARTAARSGKTPKEKNKIFKNHHCSQIGYKKILKAQTWLVETAAYMWWWEVVFIRLHWVWVFKRSSKCRFLCFASGFVFVQQRQLWDFLKQTSWGIILTAAPLSAAAAILIFAWRLFHFMVLWSRVVDVTWLQLLWLQLLCAATSSHVASQQQKH